MVAPPVMPAPFVEGSNRKRVGTHEMGAREEHPIWFDAAPNLGDLEAVEPGGGLLVLYQLPFWQPVASVGTPPAPCDPLDPPDPLPPAAPYLGQTFFDATRAMVMVGCLEPGGTYLLEWTWRTVMADASTPAWPLTRFTLELKIRCV